MINSNFTDLIKYKDYYKVDSYIPNEITYVANLDDEGIVDYIPFSVQKINIETDFLVYPIITNCNRDNVHGTYLAVYNLTSNSLSVRTDIFRVYFVNNKVLRLII